MKSPKELLRHARRLVKGGWIKGMYVYFPDLQKGWGPNASMDVLKDMLERSKKKSANPQCMVCAEGAVYLACALDGQNAETARNIIDRHLLQELPRQPSDSMYRYGSVPSFNDDEPTKEEDVIKIFDRAEEKMV